MSSDNVSEMVWMREFKITPEGEKFLKEYGLWDFITKGDAIQITKNQTFQR